MINPIVDISQCKAARIADFGLLIMAIIAFIIDDFILSNRIVPGDPDALAKCIKINVMLFGLAVVRYLIIFILDAAIALALYIILTPANKMLALHLAALNYLREVVSLKLPFSLPLVIVQI